jgi:molybdopterin biosynthesis enzyme
MVDPQPQRIARLTPLADAMARIDELVAPVGPRRITLATAAGRHLAADIVVDRPRPASPIALRDGIALRAEATLDASSYAPIRVDGRSVDVGDALPAGADAVAPPDAVEMRGNIAFAVAPLASGDSVLPTGADGASGDTVGIAGKRLRDVDLATLAVLGVAEVEVREPRICVVPAAAGNDAIIGVAVDWLKRVIAGAGGVTVAAGADADAVIVVGGSGGGRRDRSIHELARLGTVTFHGVGLAPGETAAFGMTKTRPVLIVPGRLDSALAVWLTLGRRMLARLRGHDDEEQSTSATLTRKIASTLGLAELVPVAREADGVTPLASGYLSLQSLARADGYVLVPADSEGFPAGARVEMRPLP